MKQSHLRTRKAISSVIGTFFFIVIMVAAFSAILTAMSFQTQLIEQQANISNVNVRKIQEDFTVTPFCIDNSPPPGETLHVLVENIGTNEIEVASVWYNLQSTPFTSNVIDVTLANRYIPPGSKINVLSDANPLADPPAGVYTIKVVTKLGNILQSEIIYPCPAGDPSKVVEDKLVAKPAVYAAFPNPWVSTADYGYFAIIVVNPSENPMRIYQSSFQLLTSNNQDVFKSPIGITPGTGTWSDFDKVVYWEDLTGILVAPYSATEFSVSAEPDSSIPSTTINTINTNTMTSFGQFGSIKIDTLATNNNRAATPNIFLLPNSVDEPPTIDPSYIILDVTSSQDIFVAVSNSGSSSGQVDKNIRDNMKLVINVPAAFTITDTNLITSASGGFQTSTQLIFDDGSTQLSYQLNSLNELAPGDLAKIGFRITPPVLTQTSVYIFHMYAYGTSGTSTTDTQIGPVAEIAVQVCKTDVSSC